MAYVAGRYEPSRRRESLSFSHHAELAALSPADQELWLDRSEAGQLSVRALRFELREARRRTALRAARHPELEPRCPHCGHQLGRQRHTIAADLRVGCRALNLPTPGESRADLVLAGGGVLGIGHVGAVSVLEEQGFRFQRIAGTSAGSIVGALLAAGLPTARLRDLVRGLDYERFLDKDALDRVPLVGAPLSVLIENGYAEGRYFVDWLERELESLGVRTFGDLRISDDGADARPEQRWRLVVMAADVTRGQLLRLPWDYERYGLDPDEQPVVSAVRASISVPYLFEPFDLRYHGGESLLVDGGLISNFPIDAFDRTDGAPPRWPTFGVTLIPQLPAGDTKLGARSARPAAGSLVPIPRVGGHDRGGGPRPGLPGPALGAGSGDGGRHVRREPFRLHGRARCGGAPVRERTPDGDGVPRGLVFRRVRGAPPADAQSSTFITRRPRSSLQRPERWSRKRSSIPPCRCVR